MEAEAVEEVVAEASEAEVVPEEEAPGEAIEEGREVAAGEVIGELPGAVVGEVQEVVPEVVSALAHPSSTTHDLPTKTKSKEYSRFPRKK